MGARLILCSNQGWFFELFSCQSLARNPYKRVSRILEVVNNSVCAGFTNLVRTRYVDSGGKSPLNENAGRSNLTQFYIAYRKYCEQAQLIHCDSTHVAVLWQDNINEWDRLGIAVRLIKALKWGRARRLPSLAIRPYCATPQIKSVRG